MNNTTPLRFTNMFRVGHYIYNITASIIQTFSFLFYCSITAETYQIYFLSLSFSLFSLLRRATHRAA